MEGGGRRSGFHFPERERSSWPDSLAWVEIVVNGVGCFGLCVIVKSWRRSIKP